MNNPFAPESHVNLYVLRVQYGSDGMLYGEIGSDVALASGGHLEGEFVKAETVASAVPGSGRRCVDMQTTVVQHDPGVMSARVMLDVVQHAATAYVREAGDAASDTYAQTVSTLEREVGAADVTALASDTLSAIDRIADDTIRQTDGSVDPALLIQSVQDANVAPAAADAMAPELQRIRAALLKQARAREAHEREARPDRSRAVTRAAVAWSTARQAALERVEQREQGEVDGSLARANEIAAEITVADTAVAGARLNAVKEKFLSFLFSENDTPAGSPQAAGMGDLRASLRAHLRAHLIVAAARQLRLALATTTTSLQADMQRTDRGTDLVARLAARAQDAAAAIDEQSDERLRRATGLFLPAHAEIRAELVRQIVATAGETLVGRVIREPLIASQRVEAALQYDSFEDAVLAAGATLTDRLREDSLAQLLARLSPSVLDTIANILAAPEVRLGFRPGYPVPQVYRRIAVPDGTDGPLGLMIRRRFSNIDVVRGTDPLLALGVAITDVFSVDQLEAYHGRWGRAREEARAAGIDRRLVSDRRLLDVEDGLTTNDDLDAFIVRGVVSGSIASSKEPPAVERAHGTWYVMPAEQLMRPSEIDPTRLDTIFNGYRLGRSLADIRTTLRHAPQHRQVIDDRWQIWCNEHSIEQRVAQIDMVMQNLLPSDELAAVCRELKGTLTREMRLRIAV